MTLTFNNIETVDRLSWWELSKEEREELDYVDPEERGLDFFRYRGNVYDLCDIPMLDSPWSKLSHVHPLVKAGYTGFIGDTYWSGIAVALLFNEDNFKEQVKVCTCLWKD